MAKSAAARKRYRQRRAALKKAVMPAAKRKASRRSIPKAAVSAVSRMLSTMPKKRKQRVAGRGRAAQIVRALKGVQTVGDGISVGKTVHNQSKQVMHVPLRREKVVNLLGSAVYSFNQYVINPGNYILFPWLSTIAANFQFYKFKTLIFSYEQEEYGASGSVVSAGKVIFATEYDVGATMALNSFPDDRAMENEYNSDKGAPFAEIFHDVLAGDHTLKHMPLKDYVVNYSNNQLGQANSDNKFFDMGVTQLAVSGTADSSSEIGELYVTYELDLIKPKQIETVDSVLLLAAHISENPVNTASATVPFGNSVFGPLETTNGYIPRNPTSFPLAGTGNSSGVANNVAFSMAVVTGVASANIVMPSVGTYLLAAVWQHSGGAITTVPAVTFNFPSNVSLQSGGFDDASASRRSGIDSSLAASYFVGMVTVSSSCPYTGNLAAGLLSANVVTFGGNAGMNSATMDLYVSQVPNDFLALAPILRSKPDLAAKIFSIEQSLERVNRMLSSTSSSCFVEPESDEDLVKIKSRAVSALSVRSATSEESKALDDAERAERSTFRLKK